VGKITALKNFVTKNCI